MNTRPQAEIREELRLVEEDLEQVRKSAASLRQRIGERADEPTDAAERAALIESADEQEALVFQLEGRREQLLAQLGSRSSG
jgi:F0F1-type ATP synthase membrane subunit b/b'